MNYQVELTPKYKLELVDNPLYNVYIKQFNEFLDHRPVTFEIIKDYLKESKKHFKPSTVACIKAALKKSVKKSFGKQSRDVIFLAALDISFNAIKVGITDKKIYQEKVLSPTEIETLKNSLSPRLALIVHILSVTGLRVSELIGIKLSNCKGDNGTVFIDIIGKGTKQRRVFITRELFEGARKEFKGKCYLFETHNHTPFSRCYIWRELRNAGNKVLGKSISPHTLRHSFCTNMLLVKNKSLKAVSNYVGHSSTSITADMYVHAQLVPEDIFENKS